ncbi:MAG: hypothetical protein QM802_19900 [Agriterribacter sp.]
MLLTALYCAIVAYVYINILIAPGMILHRWAVFLEKDLVKETFEPMYQRKEHWLYKPLIGCELCCAGQLGLWSGLFSEWFDPINLVIVICMAILFTKTISLIINKLQ